MHQITFTIIYSGITLWHRVIICTMINVSGTLLKVLHRRTIFVSAPNHSVKGSLKHISFSAFVKQKGSSDVKGCLWKHVVLWHREASLFLRVYVPLSVE